MYISYDTRRKEDPQTTIQYEIRTSVLHQNLLHVKLPSEKVQETLEPQSL